MVPLLHRGRRSGRCWPGSAAICWARCSGSGRAVVAAGVAVLLAASTSRMAAPVLAVLGIGLAAWLATGALVEWAERVRLFRDAAGGQSAPRALHLPRAAYGMTFAHLGLAVVAVAGIAASAFGTEAIEAVQPGDSLTMAGYTTALRRGAATCRGPNYTADARHVRLTARRRDDRRDASGAALLPAAAADHQRDRDPHQSARRPLRRARRSATARAAGRCAPITSRWCRGSGSAR